MECPICGNADSIPINIENTLLECSKCRYRFHISGMDQIEIGYMLDPDSPNTTELTNILNKARSNAEPDKLQGK